MNRRDGVTGPATEHPFARLLPACATRRFAQGRETHMRLVVASLVAASLALSSAAFAAPRADIVAYGDHVPSLTYAGAPFVNPFDNREDANDAYTRVAVEAVSGLKHPLGSIGWGVVALGKYVLTGNYDEAMM